MGFIYSLPPFLTAALLIALAVLALSRGGGAQVNRLFSLLCFSGGLLYIDILIAFNTPSADVALLSNRLGHGLYPFLVPLFIHLFHAVLNIEGRRWIVRLAYGYAAVLAMLALGDGMIAEVHRFSFGYMGQAGRFYPFMAAGSAAATLYNIYLIYNALRRERSGERRNRLRYILAGFGGLGVLSTLNFLPLFGVALYPPGVFGFIPMAVLAAGLFRHDLLDMGLLWRKGLLFSVLTAVLTAAYALVIVLVDVLLRSHRLSETLFFPVLLFVLITFLFGPLKQRAQSALESRFARGRFDYQQTIKRISRTITAVLDYAAIDRLLRETIVEALKAEKGALMVREGPLGRFVPIAAVGETWQGTGFALDAGHPVIRRLESGPGPIVRRPLVQPGPDDEAVDPLMLHAEVILPMRFQDRLNGLLVLGAKRSGDSYSREDLDLLETLCNQSALAIENARVYQKLKKLNQNLEQRVAHRTQALETALKEKERTQEQLIRSESLAALGQLVAGVAHELNNPLTSVTSLLQSTAEDLQRWTPGQPLDADWIDDLHFADKELARARSIVASLLGLARQTQTYAESVDINSVVRDALRVLHNQCKYAAVTIKQELSETLPAIHGNFANLGQVALNIIKNALQAVAGQPDGMIVLHSGFMPDSNQITFACQDNGCGIDAAIRKDVFKPFFTTKPVGQGTGLGLYICHEIVQKHGGSIQVQPADPQGTLVTVNLPLNPPKTA